MPHVRGLKDTEAERDEHTTQLTRIIGAADWSDAFVRHHIKMAIDEAQQRTLDRVMANLAASAERQWTAAAPVPASAVRGILAPPAAESKMLESAVSR